jgi:hypothetical protein
MQIKLENIVRTHARRNNTLTDSTASTLRSTYCESTLEETEPNVRPELVVT